MELEYCPDCGGDISFGWKLMVTYKDNLDSNLKVSLLRDKDVFVLEYARCEDCGWAFPEQDFDDGLKDEQRRVAGRYIRFRDVESRARALTAKSGVYA